MDKAAFSRWGSVLFSSTVDGDTRDFQFLWLRLLSGQDIRRRHFGLIYTDFFDLWWPIGFPADTRHGVPEGGLIYIL